MESVWAKLATGVSETVPKGLEGRVRAQFTSGAAHNLFLRFDASLNSNGKNNKMRNNFVIGTPVNTPDKDERDIMKIEELTIPKTKLPAADAATCSSYIYIYIYIYIFLF